MKLNSEHRSRSLFLLSVSSTDRIAMKPSAIGVLYKMCCLSVSSTDRIAMKRVGLVGGVFTGTTFQYPQRIELQ